MAATAGKKARVKVSTTSGGSYTAVLGIDTISHSIDGTNIDVSEMGDDYVARIQGMKDGKISMSGNLRMDDATGQQVIKDGYLAGTDLFFQFLPDGGTTADAGFQQQMWVSSFKTDAGQQGKVAVSIELEGSGAITSV